MTKKKPAELPPNLEMLQIDKLRPHPKNPKQHPAVQVDGLGSAEGEFGWLSAIVVDEKGTLLAGEGRWMMARKKGIAAVPGFVVRGWSEEKKLAFMVSDNRWPMLGTFDDLKLRAALGDLKLAEYDYTLIGYDDVQFAEAIAVETVGLTDPEATPAPPTKPIVRPGDLWTLGAHLLICGSSTDPEGVRSLFEAAATPPVLMVTDPPYGVNYDPTWRLRAGVSKNKKKMGKVSNDDRADWREAWKLFPGDAAYVWHGALHSGEVEASLAAVNFKIRSQIIWCKDRFALGRGDYHWQHEPCWYAVRDGSRAGWAGGRNKSTRWDIPSREDGGHGHGTQKPVECMKRPIENNSRKGQSVYDPFLGSGTTVIACEITGRRALAVELDPAYCQIAIERWQAFAGQSATLDGVEFDKVAAARRKGKPTGGKNAKGHTRVAIRRPKPVAAAGGVPAVAK